MDVLYSYRDFGDSWDLRYSLRSRAANMASVGRVIVAGDPPEWLSDEVVKVVCPHPFRRKQQNILFAITVAMEAAGVEGPCISSSDDHFVMAPCDADALPHFRRVGRYAEIPSESTYRSWNWPITPYRGSMAATRALLDAHGLATVNMSGHFDTVLDGRDLKDVLKIAGDYGSTEYGYEPSSLFLALAMRREPFKTVAIGDRKLSQPLGMADCGRYAADSGMFMSVDKSARCGDFRAWMEVRFPEPSRWEKR